MRKLISFILVFCLLFALAGCGAGSAANDNSTPSASHSQTETPAEEAASSEVSPEEMDAAADVLVEETAEPADVPEEPALPEAPAEETSKMLVVYFSATGNTKAVAEKIAELTGADLYEIVPAEPYTDADLDYNNDDCRANQEMDDESARPAIGSETIDISAYETVFIGYPIWWGTMPRIINTFLDTYDLSGKTVLPFCTSGGSGISQSVSDIQASVPGADVRNGLRASDANDSSIDSWIADNSIGQ